MVGADVVWLLVSCALVLLMTPGLAMFYGGMVRSKNVLNTLMMSLVAMSIVTIEWIAIGYSMSFGKDIWHVVGGFNYVLFKGVGLSPSEIYAKTVPHVLFATFQMMFAIITPALMSGAVVERMKFSSYMLFILFWAIFVYNPICHWVWGDGGWLGKLGALDFAGGTVVHINAGISALVAALIIGKRREYMKEPILPNNIVLTAIGTALLWFGWFGFNAGSALAADKTAALAFINTHVAASSAALAWIMIEFLQHGMISTIGFCSGAVAGLVAITPAAGFVSVWKAVFIGVGAGLICYIAVVLKNKLGYDDSLDVFGVHGVGGIWGAIATGIFAVGGSVWKQFLATGVTIVYAGFVTFIILKVIDGVMGLRVDEEVEVGGLDISVHGESGYKIW